MLKIGGGSNHRGRRPLRVALSRDLPEGEPFPAETKSYGHSITVPTILGSPNAYPEALFKSLPNQNSSITVFTTASSPGI